MKIFIIAKHTHKSTPSIKSPTSGTCLLFLPRTSGQQHSWVRAGVGKRQAGLSGHSRLLASGHSLPPDHSGRTGFDHCWLENTPNITGLPSVFSVVRTRESVLMIWGCTRTCMEKEEKEKESISQMRKLRFREAAEIKYLAKGAIRKGIFVFLKSVKRKAKITTTSWINEFWDS